MSENPNFPSEGDGFFASVMEVLVPEGDGAAAGAGGAPAGAPAGGGQPAGDAGAGAAAPAAGGAGDVAGAPGVAGAVAPAPAGGPVDTGAAAPTAGAPVAGAAGAAPVAGGAAGAAAGAEAPADAQAGVAGGGAGDGAAGAAGTGAAGALEHAALAPKLGELTNAFEERLTKKFQEDALAEVREEYGRYFEALQVHPRMLVGTEVAAIGREGMERIQSTQDARDWQEAVKQILGDEIRERANKQLDEQRGVLDTVHASVQLFQSNADLLPGTKTFDRDLADRFAAMAKPYELRVDGKLHGYTIPVQPLVDSIRAQVQAERAAAAAAAPAGSPAPAANGGAATAPSTAPAAASTPEPPQAGIASKAGSSTEREDYSTLFGTIGLPNLQI